jgi:hypothetical protein
MGVTVKVPSEGGSGGGRGHSNMEHWDHTDAIKTAARGVRRRQDRLEIDAQLIDGDEGPEAPCASRSTSAAP